MSFTSQLHGCTWYLKGSAAHIRFTFHLHVLWEELVDDEYVSAFAIAGSNLPFYNILSLLCLDSIFGNHMESSQMDPVEGKTLGK